MAGKIDLLCLKSQVEAAMEALLRAADARVSWNQSPPQEQQQHSGAVDSGFGASLPYTFIPGVYRSVPPGGNGNPGAHENDSEAVTNSHGHPYAHTTTSTELNDDELRIVLHGDNSFEYSWTMKRSGARAMEFVVEMVGEWSKPVLNRSRRGDEDQRVFLHAKKMRFQRLSNYDAETDTWKLCLKTLTRHGSDWALVGETERGVPPIVIILSCNSDSGGASLESMGAALASQVLTNSPACRVLAGLTKKIANKLGAPIDVMTDRWLPARHVVLARAPEPEQQCVRAFNPFFCLAEALLIHKQQQTPKQQQLPPEHDVTPSLPVSA